MREYTSTDYRKLKISSYKERLHLPLALSNQLCDLKMKGGKSLLIVLLQFTYLSSDYISKQLKNAQLN